MTDLYATQTTGLADGYVPAVLKDTYDVVVIGGGPSGATAAQDLAIRGYSVLLIDKPGRIKPCGGAIPPRLIRDFDIPPRLLCARISSARMIAPSDKTVDMPIDGGYVGMVDREVFDEFLRERAAECGAERFNGSFDDLERDADGRAMIAFSAPGDEKASRRVYARMVIGADGAKSKVKKLGLPNVKPAPCVFAYHEIVSTESGDADASRLTDMVDYDGGRCDVYYQGKLSPDFYAWVFPHGKTASIGVGSANKGFSLRSAVRTLRADTGLNQMKTVRTEGAPIPMKPIKRWDNGKDLIVCGDAAGVVAPASGEGIYYAMVCGRYAADAVQEYLMTDNPAALKTARRKFMKDHGRVFFVLGLLQYFWYCSDKRREKFVKMCEDEDVQRLTWTAYMNKELVRRDPLAHIKVFMKDMAQLLGLARA
ncbi:MAG: geranylgeranyl diphosphate reductase [Pseudomonadota bacterium]